MQSNNNFLIVKEEIIEEKRSKGNIILNMSSVFNESFREEFEKRNICFAEVVYDNPNIDYLKAGDRIAMNPGKGSKTKMEFEEFTAITTEQFVAKVNKDGSYTIPPNSLMVKIKKEDSDGLFSKWITRNDGTKVQLFLRPNYDKEDMARSSVFVTIGEIVQVGINVSDIEIGDKAILDYTADNDIDNILYYDKDWSKYMVIDAETTYHKSDYWIRADRREEYNKDLKKIVRTNPKDTLLYAKGDMDIISPLLGFIRNEKLIARQPYVFLEHESSIVEKTSQMGITYSEQQFILERKILSASDESKKKYGEIISEGKVIIIEDADMFDVQLSEYKIQCVLDKDIIAAKK